MHIVNSKEELKELLKKDSSIKKIKLNFKDASNLYKEVLKDLDPLFNKINVSEWDTSNVTNMSYMLYGAEHFNQPLDKWNTSKVTNMNNIFKNSGLKIPPKNIKLLKEYYKKD